MAFLRKALLLWLVLLTPTLAQSPNPAQKTLEDRLEKALLIMDQSQQQGPLAQQMAADAIAGVFFDPGLMTDRFLVEKLSRRFLEFIQKSATNLDEGMRQKLVEAFSRHLETLPEDQSYEKKGWLSALIVAILVPTAIHLTDGFVYIAAPLANIFASGVQRFIWKGFPSIKMENAPLKGSLSRLSRVMDRRGRSCKWKVSRMAWHGASRILYLRHPNIFIEVPGYVLQSSLLTGALVYFPSKSLYFSQYENWDATEDEVQRRIIPMLEEIEAKTIRSN